MQSALVRILVLSMLSQSRMFTLITEMRSQLLPVFDLKVRIDRELRLSCLQFAQYRLVSFDWASVFSVP